jgi:hypothetical protein
MDSSTTNGEREDNTERTLPLSPANGSGKEGRNSTANATTMTNYEVKASGAAD